MEVLVDHLHEQHDKRYVDAIMGSRVDYIDNRPTTITALIHIAAKSLKLGKASPYNEVRVVELSDIIPR